ncbi:MAG: hypothetical protein WAO83_04755 [Fuerstiella sp.]
MIDVSQQLQQLVVRNSAEPRFRTAIVSGSIAEFQAALHKHFGKSGKRLQKLIGDVPLVASWSAGFVWPDEADRQIAVLIDDVSDLSGSALTTGIRRIVEFAASCFQQDAASVSPLVALTTTEILLRYAADLDPTDVAVLYTGIARLAGEVFELSSELLLASDSLIFSAVSVCELPFIFSILLEPLKHAKKLQDVARSNLARLISETSDTDGTPYASLLSAASHWLAPFSRVSVLAAATEFSWCSKSTAALWRKHVQCFVLLGTSAGLVSTARLALGQPAPQDFGFRQLGLAVGLADFSKPSAVLKLAGDLASGKQPDAHKADSKKLQLPKSVPLCGQSDWAHSARMRTTTKLTADVLSATWNDATFNVGLAALGARIIAGCWASEVQVDGNLIASMDDWACTCWFQDEEVAFVELESSNAEGVRHIRQILLSLVDHFALLTDSITAGDCNSAVSVNSRLPLMATTADSNSITRELRIRSHVADVVVAPTWLNDDRLYNATGDCKCVDGELLLSDSGVGGVTLPLLLDWNPKRSSSDADWNRLTVTEDRRVLTGFDAAAFRARIGRFQMLIYRSIRKGESLRAVLGHNTGNETVYGYIADSGQIKPLVVVDSEV